MGLTPNTRQAGLYARMVELYPADYRRRYGQPMVQTFDDLLEAEPTQLGKLLIWLRAFWDVPSSALKEHVTNGKGIVMNRTFKYIFSGIIVLLILANGVSFWSGYVNARSNVGIVRVTPTQLADAMKQDDFYSTYGSAAVLFTGKIVSVQQRAGATVATFQTDHAFALECQFAGAEQLAVGSTVSVAAPAGNAERLHDAVLLHGCVKN